MSRYTLPLFPLPDTVLYPGLALPLHIFEPRYRRLLADALDGAGLVGMALLRPGWEPDYYGNPPIHAVMGAGRIGDYDTHEDGTSHITLIGTGRVIIQEELPPGEYRTASVEDLPDVDAPGRDAALDDAGARLREGALGMLDQARPGEETQALREIVNERGSEPVMLAHLFATVFVRDPEIRQRVLEERDPARRVDMVAGFLRTMASERPDPEGKREGR